MTTPGDLPRPQETPLTPEGWIKFIRRQGGCVLGTEHSEGFRRDWIINSMPLSQFFVDRYDGPMTVLHENLKVKATHNPTLREEFIQLYVAKFLRLTVDDVYDKYDHILVAPLYQIRAMGESRKEGFRMLDVVEQTDYASELAYVASFRYPGRHTNRGTIGMNVNVILPESFAASYVQQIQNGSFRLPRNIAEGLYSGIDSEGRCQKTAGLLLVADLNRVIQDPMDYTANEQLLRDGKITAAFYPYTK